MTKNHAVTSKPVDVLSGRAASVLPAGNGSADFGSVNSAWTWSATDEAKAHPRFAEIREFLSEVLERPCPTNPRVITDSAGLHWFVC